MISDHPGKKIKRKQDDVHFPWIHKSGMFDFHSL